MREMPKFRSFKTAPPRDANPPCICLLVPSPRGELRRFTVPLLCGLSTPPKRMRVATAWALPLVACCLLCCCPGCFAPPPPSFQVIFW